MKNEAVSEEHSETLKELFCFTENMHHLLQMIPRKRETVFGTIPERVVYISPQLLGDTFIFGRHYDIINMQGSTEIHKKRSKVDQLVG